jgi:hypothetical protein
VIPSRSCKGTTKAGKPCKAHPLKDRDECLAHADATTRESVGFVADNGYAGRKPKPKPDEVARRLIEDNIAALLRPHFRTLGYDVVMTDEGPRLVERDEGGAKVFGTRQATGEIVVSPHDDLGAQMTASEKLQDRVYGKPRQSVEHTGADGGPIETSNLDLGGLEPVELKALRDLLRKAQGE